jgi:hypothetical protein
MNTNHWTDFNDAEAQQGGFNLIPKGTLVPVRMTIKPGGHDDYSQGWTGGYATQSFDTGAVYLACEFVVTAGEFAKRKLWTNIGLHSAKGPKWGQMGRSFIRALLNSSRGIQPGDVSPQAVAGRRISGINELDGIEFIAQVDIEKDGKGEDRNVVKHAIEPDHPGYAAMRGQLMSPSPMSAPRVPRQSPQTQPQPGYPQSTTRPEQSGKPAWAQ